MIIELHSSAKKYLIDGYYFYENQELTIGQYFLDTLFSDIDSLVITAGTHPIVHDEYFRMLSKRFPFAIYYKIKTKSYM